MLRTAKDCLRIRDEKLKIFNKSQEEIKGQMKLIESKYSSKALSTKLKTGSTWQSGKSKTLDISTIYMIESETNKRTIK